MDTIPHTPFIHHHQKREKNDGIDAMVENWSVYITLIEARMRKSIVKCCSHRIQHGADVPLCIFFNPSIFTCMNLSIGEHAFTCGVDYFLLLLLLPLFPLLFVFHTLTTWNISMKTEMERKIENSNTMCTYTCKHIII